MVTEKTLKEEIELAFKYLKEEPIEFWTTDSGSHNIQFILNYNGELDGVRLHTHIGGPSIHLDTESGELYGHWAGQARTSCPFNHNMCDDINDYYEDDLPLLRQSTTGEMR